MRKYQNLLMWIVLVGGLLWGYEGLTGIELHENVLGASLAMVFEVAVGLAAVLLIYWQLSKTQKKSK